jgi:hypothetical protein
MLDERHSYIERKRRKAGSGRSARQLLLHAVDNTPLETINASPPGAIDSRLNLENSAIEFHRDADSMTDHLALLIIDQAS